MWRTGQTLINSRTVFNADGSVFSGGENTISLRCDCEECHRSWVCQVKEHMIDDQKTYVNPQWYEVDFEETDDEIDLAHQEVGRHVMELIDSLAFIKNKFFG